MIKIPEEHVVCIIGKSGSGKDTLVDYVCTYLKLNKLPSYTTRPKRKDEFNGINHTFISLPYLKNNIFGIVAGTYFNGYYYCATYQQIKDNDIYIIDTLGLSQLLRYNNLKVLPIYIEVPFYIRFYRMLKRGDGFINIIKRMWAERKNIYKTKDMKHVVVNKKLDVAIDNITKILESVYGKKS